MLKPRSKTHPDTKLQCNIVAEGETAGAQCGASGVTTLSSQVPLPMLQKHAQEQQQVQREINMSASRSQTPSMLSEQNWHGSRTSTPVKPQSRRRNISSIPGLQEPLGRLNFGSTASSMASPTPSSSDLEQWSDSVDEQDQEIPGGSSFLEFNSEAGGFNSFMDASTGTSNAYSYYYYYIYGLPTLLSALILLICDVNHFHYMQNHPQP